ncbi:patatin family protein [Mediterraneibacter glycyrrhizinilyticus]|uniref:patatin-like phospholipase family protein n=1 Tax=Mediterraneibacter glycyrrhizinilyticus TaxID=342942 RepID=UPI001960EAAA|nr:patatin family protein [Mediterraneibacter glycyrrhizinilyticus]MBM6751210.1 patatin family protein [Mediterraneibacter glycyrrhizinilyticus]HJC90423.1 patatin family protein [Candidatus Mediterraneibacter excrementigallinarum]
MDLIKATLVLEGGATRGVFTSGVLDLLMEKGIYVSHVIGVSAGTCNAVDYVSRQPGRTRDCMIPADKSGNYYYGMRDFVKEKSLMNMDLIFDKFPNEILPFDYDTYFSSEMECEIVTTNCLTGKAEYMTERKDRERLMKICRASCSMPLLTPIVNVDDVPYLDGGLADSVPVGRAKEIGNEKIIVVLTKNQGYRKKVPSKGLQRVYRRAYHSYPNLVRTILRRSFEYNKTMNHLDQLEKRGEIFVLRPQVKPVSRLERNKESLLSFYEHGYQLAERKLDDMMKYLEC